ncbi:MAG: response regulator [Thermodesulfobacteriota bacterium]
MKKHLNFGFISICILVAISSTFLLVHSKKGGHVLNEITSDITPGAIAMTEMATTLEEIGHYSLHSVTDRNDRELGEKLKKAVASLQRQGQIHLAHERHVGLEEKKAAQLLLAKIENLSNSVAPFHTPTTNSDYRELQNHELAVVHADLRDLKGLLLFHKNTHLAELESAFTTIRFKKNILSQVIIGSSLALVLAVIVIWHLTMRIYGHFLTEQQAQQRKIELDFQEKKEIEKKLQNARKMESIGLMAGGVAHDLNNILSGIIGYPELILQELPQESRLRKRVEAIQQSGQRAAVVVADLLTVARSAATTRENYNLNALINNYLDTPECQKLKSLHPAVSWVQRPGAGNSFISCSPVHIQKCLMNLVTNGCEAIEGRGSVAITSYDQCITEDSMAKYGLQPGDYVVLSVKDTGLGISKKDLEHIFEPFYTRKVMGRSGSGLGLTVVWNTMEDHNGKVFVESDENGTCFQLFFPVSKKESASPALAGDSEEVRGRGEHILVVDDELQLRDIACQMLTSLGYRVDKAQSGESAIEFIKKKPVDLLLLDMLMEPGLSGRQTYAEITKIYPEQKAIIASGFSKSEDVRATLQLGAGGFIKKPYSMQQLGLAVGEVLSS